MVALARRSRSCTGRPVGVAPETKHPSYFRTAGLPLEKWLLQVLEGYGGAEEPVLIQSFETGNVKALSGQTDLFLVQLVDCAGALYDLRAAGDRRTYADLVTPAGLAQISRYADGVGLCKFVTIPRDANARLLAPLQ